MKRDCEANAGHGGAGTNPNRGMERKGKICPSILYACSQRSRFLPKCANEVHEEMALDSSNQTETEHL